MLGVKSQPPYANAALVRICLILVANLILLLDFIYELGNYSFYFNFSSFSLSVNLKKKLLNF